MELRIELLHRRVESVEVLVAEVAVINEVPLPSCIAISIVVACAREVNPLWMPELIAYKVEVSLAAEAKGEEADEFMQRNPARDDRALHKDAHFLVEFGIHQLHRQRLIADNPLVVAFDVSDMFFASAAVE